MKKSRTIVRRRPGMTYVSFSYERAAELYRQGLSQQQVATKLGVTRGAIIYALHAQEVAMRPMGRQRQS